MAACAVVLAQAELGQAVGLCMAMGASPPEMADKAARDNTANQKNPNHEPTGPGKQAGYHGDAANKDNRSQQKNPNNEKFAGGNGPQASSTKK